MIGDVKYISQEKLKKLLKLKKKKYQKLYNLFIVEGTKVLYEFIKNNWNPEYILATEKWIKKNNFFHEKLYLIEYEVIKKLSSLKNPPGVVGFFKKKLLNVNQIPINDFLVCFYNLQNPSNVGAIIRSGLWFGFKHYIFSNNSVDTFNNKVIQSSVGAISKVSLYEIEKFEDFLIKKGSNYNIYFADLEGTPIYDVNFSYPSIIVFGNESFGFKTFNCNNGNTINIKKIFIPYFKEKEIDSLNVAMSATIFFYEINRQLKRK